MAVDCFTVSAHNRRDVFGTLHAPFYFERINTGVHQLRDQVDRIEVTRRQQKISRRIAEDIMSPAIHERIWKPAGLRAPAAIPAAPADHTAHQALPGITYAERAVYKTFDFYAAVRANRTNFFERKFTREYNARKSQLL